MLNGRGTGIRIAFGDRPGEAVRVGAGDGPGARWLAAVALGAQGWYAAAATLLQDVDRHPDTPLAVRAHAAATRAAHLRQLGGHQAARRWDARALALSTPPYSAPASARPLSPGMSRDVGTCAPARAPAGVEVDQPPGGGAHRASGAWAGGGDASGNPGLDLAAARVDALLGLAADAVGLGDPGLAGRLLAAAEPAAAEHPSWRPGVRWGWVRAERALAVGRPADAVRYAERAGRSAERADATRHVLKSRLVLTVAQSAAGRPEEEIVDVLLGLAAHVRDTHLRTLEWPIELLLGNLAGSRGLTHLGEHRRRAHQILADIRAKTDPCGRKVFDRSPWVPDITGTRLLHSDPCHPPETCRSPQSSRMECRISP